MNTKSSVEKIILKRLLFSIGLSKDREYFVENLSVLISSDMPILTALDSISSELQTKRMKNIVLKMKDEIESGTTLWKTFENSTLFPEHAISLIKLGEESGNLSKNLKVVAAEQVKNRIFKSKLRSAMMYPIFVLGLTGIIGLGIAWFILPKLATVFSQLKVTLPLITKILIGTGFFLGKYGLFVVPTIVIAIVLFVYIIFIFSKTKFIGQFILFLIPGIKDLIKEVEIARLGYLLGTLLSAGIPITNALDSLASATGMSNYKKLYIYLSKNINEGNSIQHSLNTFKHANKLIPTPIQQLIITGEQSGKLPESLLDIGQTFETKTDTSTKNLTIILEPILLFVVWLGVVGVALAVILPIYSLVGKFNSGSL